MILTLTLHIDLYFDYWRLFRDLQQLPNWGNPHSSLATQVLVEPFWSLPPLIIMTGTKLMLMLHVHN